MLQKGLQLKCTNLLVSFLWIVKSLNKIVNNSIVDYLEKWSLFYDFQYGFRSSESTADFLTAVSDRIARAFNRSGATQGVVLGISKVFDIVWHGGHLHKLKSYGTSGQIFGLILSFLSNRQLGVAMYENSSQEYLVKAGVTQGSICCATLFLRYTLMTSLLMLSVILLSMLVITLYCKCDQTSDLWQQLKLTSELISDPKDTLGRKWLVDFNPGKTKLVLFDQSSNIVKQGKDGTS